MKAIGDVLRTCWRARGSDVFTVLVSFIYWSALNTITAVSVTNYTPRTGSEEPCDEHGVRRCPSRHFLCRKVVSCASGKTPVVSDSGTSHICLLLRCGCCLGNTNLTMIFSCEIHYACAVVQSLSQFDFFPRNMNSCKPATIINQLLNMVTKWRELFSFLPPQSNARSITHTYVLYAPVLYVSVFPQNTATHSSLLLVKSVSLCFEERQTTAYSTGVKVSGTQRNILIYYDKISIFIPTPNLL